MKELSSIGSWLKSGWSEYTRHFSKYLAISAVGAVFGIVLALVTGISFMASGLVKKAPGPLALIVLLLFLVVQFWVQATLIIEAKNQTSPLSIAEAFRVSFAKLPQYIWTAIITGIVTAIGFMLLVIPGFIFMVWFVFSQYLVYEEGLSGFSAMSASKNYAKGYGLQIFARLFTVGILYIVIAGVCQAIFGRSNWVGQVIVLLLSPLAVILAYNLLSEIKALKNSASVETSGQVSQAEVVQ